MATTGTEKKPLDGPSRTLNRPRGHGAYEPLRDILRPTAHRLLAPPPTAEPIVQNIGKQAIFTFDTPHPNAPESVQRSHPLSVDKQRLFDILLGHSAFQYFYAGIKLGILERILRQPKISLEELSETLDLPTQSTQIAIRGLVSLDLVEEQEHLYQVAPVIDTLDRAGRWTLVKAWTLFEAEIVYPGLHGFVSSLSTGKAEGLKYLPGDGGTLYKRLSSLPETSTVFFDYMSAWSREASRLLCESVQESFGNTLDIGGGDATVARALVRSHLSTRITLLDLPETCKLARATIEPDLETLIDTRPCDFFEASWPEDYDTVLFAHQLVIWSLDECEVLLKKAFGSLRAEGRVVILSSVMEDSGTSPSACVMDIPYFVAVPVGGGSIYSWSDYEELLQNTGFDEIRRIRPANAWTPHGIVIATKPGDASA